MTQPAEETRLNWFTPDNLRALLEPLARLGAITVAATYVTGFLVVIQHHAQFGIVDIGVLHARVMAAGVLLDFLTLLPIIATSRLYGWLGLTKTGGFALRTRDEDGFFRETILATSVFLVSVALANFTSILFVYEPGGNSWFLLGYGLLIPDPVLTHRFSYNHPRKMAAMNVVIVGVAAWATAIVMGRGLLLRALWFFACGLAARLLRGAVRTRAWRSLELEQYVGFWIGLLVFFSVSIYGGVKSQFGGGAPVPLTVYLTGDAPKLFESNPAKAWMVEQTDQGWYLLRAPNDHKSLFVPRALVRAIELGTDAGVESSPKTGVESSPTAPRRTKKQ